MEPTTGLILRRITQTELSVSAHKLATVILDAIAWKEGFNGLSRGTAAFTLAGLASKMNISRQYLTELLAEIYAGRKRHRTYRMFKMYNDPALNPYLYAPVRQAG